jgi:hypothetical protein
MERREFIPSMVVVPARVRRREVVLVRIFKIQKTKAQKERRGDPGVNQGGMSGSFIFKS